MRISIDSCCCCSTTETPHYFLSESINPTNSAGPTRCPSTISPSYSRLHWVSIFNTPTCEQTNRYSIPGRVLYWAWYLLVKAIDTHRQFHIPVGQTIGIDRQFHVPIGHRNRCRSTMWQPIVRTIAYCTVLSEPIGLRSRYRWTDSHTCLKNNSLLYPFLWTYWSKQ